MSRQAVQATHADPVEFRVTHGNDAQIMDLRQALSAAGAVTVDLTDCEFADKHTVWHAIASALSRQVRVTVRVRKGTQPHTSLTTLALARCCEHCDMEVVE